MQFSPDRSVDNACYILAHYDSSSHILDYSLLDDTDPTKGISISYPSGEPCKTGGISRSATIDILCDNVEKVVVSAQEPSHCNYHLTMKSYYGCPTVRLCFKT